MAYNSYYDTDSSTEEFDCESFVNKFNRLSINASNRFPQKIKLDETLLNINIVRNNQEGNTSNYLEINDALSYNILSKKSTTFKNIRAKFAQQKLHVLSVQQVVNPFLKVAFDLKRQFEYDDIEPVELYHGTKEKYVDNICSYNWDWRLSGSEKGHKYGYGVNFTKYPLFSAIFSDKGAKGVTIVADVLISEVAVGTENRDLPPKGYDTTTGSGDKKHIFVKFCDNEFYPKFVVHYVRMKK